MVTTYFAENGRFSHMFDIVKMGMPLSVWEDGEFRMFLMHQLGTDMLPARFENRADVRIKVSCYMCDINTSTMKARVTRTVAGWELTLDSTDKRIWRLAQRTRLPIIEKDGLTAERIKAGIAEIRARQALQASQAEGESDDEDEGDDDGGRIIAWIFGIGFGLFGIGLVAAYVCHFCF